MPVAFEVTYCLDQSGTVVYEVTTYYNSTGIHVVKRVVCFVGTPIVPTLSDYEWKRFVWNLCWKVVFRFFFAILYSTRCFGRRLQRPLQFSNHVTCLQSWQKLHTVLLDAECQAKQLWIPIFTILGLTWLGNASSTRPVISKMRFVIKVKWNKDPVPAPKENYHHLCFFKTCILEYCLNFRGW